MKLTSKLAHLALFDTFSLIWYLWAVEVESLSQAPVLTDNARLEKKCQPGCKRTSFLHLLTFQVLSSSLGS
jgi:hypothetical protein